MANRPQQRPGCDHARPTRELVSQLNQRARAHRLAAEADSNQRDASRLAMMADGSPASVGEQVITTPTTELSGLTASDWVKNGDRWTVLKVQPAAVT